MEALEAFKELREACDGVIVAMEKDDEKEIEKAMGHFLLTCVTIQSL
jgi:hypothetical protein